MSFKERIKRFIDRCPNKYMGRRGEKPDIIVLHNTGGNKISSAHHWFLDSASQTSAHFLVGRDGEVRQYVDIADAAWCNGTTTDSTKAHFYGNASCCIVSSRPKNANLYTVSVEFVGEVGEGFTLRQKAVAVELIDSIITDIENIYGTKFPLNRFHVISHSEVAPITRGCCGAGFDIDSLIAEVSELREERRFRGTIGGAKECLSGANGDIFKGKNKTVSRA